MPYGAIRVRGLRELDRSFGRISKDLRGDLRDELRVAAEPVRSDAAALARSQITKMTVPWSEMRIGVTAKNVYVAPKRRATRQPHRKRKNLAGLLLNRAMLVALEQNRTEITRRIERMLEIISRKHGF